MKQRECVLVHVQNNVSEFGINWEINQDIKTAATKEFTTHIVDQVTSDILTGKCEMKNKKSDEKETRRYVVGMVNDAFRKDRRLNGDQKYEFKNPGSRAGTGDEIIKTLRQHMKTIADPVLRTKIETEINSRVAALKPAAPVVDLSVLPADMLERLGIQA